MKGAVVKLFMKKHPKDCCDTCDMEPITFAFTDDCGQFLFGVESEKDYIIKVFYYRPEKPVNPQSDKDCDIY